MQIYEIVYPDIELLENYLGVKIETENDPFSLDGANKAVYDWFIHNGIDEEAYARASNIISHKIIREQKTTIIAEAITPTTDLLNTFEKFNSYKTNITPVIGKSYTLLSLTAEELHAKSKKIRLDGFTTPSEVVNYIRGVAFFRNGKTFPDLKTVLQQTTFWKQTIFFDENDDKINQFITLFELLSDEQGDWKYKNLVDKEENVS